MVEHLFLTWCVFNISVCFYFFYFGFYLWDGTLVFCRHSCSVLSHKLRLMLTVKLAWLSSLIVNIEINLENLVLVWREKRARFKGCKVSKLFCFIIVIIGIFLRQNMKVKMTPQVLKGTSSLLTRDGSALHQHLESRGQNVGLATSLPVAGIFLRPARPPLLLTSCAESDDVWMKCSSYVFLFFTKSEICDIFQRIYNKNFIDQLCISACFF